MEFIDLKAQYRRLQSSIQTRITKVMESGHFIMGPEIMELEMALAARVGAKYCISCSSGTDALMLAMMALGITQGDEVISTPFTFIATGEMIAMLGAVPRWVDIDSRTYNLNPSLLETAISARTKAIMPVALYGQCADMDVINSVAARHNLAVIEDAAQSFGAMYKGRYSCNLSTIGCTSFFPSKPLGCYGDGGACFTNDETLATAMREIRVHGQDRRYHHPRLGFNGRLDTLQAAVLLAKLEIFDEELDMREQLACQYSSFLTGLATIPHVEPYNRSAWAQYTIQVTDRAFVQKRLAEQGIPTAVHYPAPLHLQPVFAHLGLSTGAFPVAERACDRVMSLPLHGYLTEGDLASVVSALKAAGENGRATGLSRQS